MSVTPQRNTGPSDSPVDMETLVNSEAQNEWEDEGEDHDDMDYEPTTEDDRGDGEDMEEEEEGEEDGDDMDTGGLEIAVTTGNTGEGDDGEEAQGVTRLSREHILEFLGGNQGLGRYLLRYLARATPNEDEGQDEDSEEPIGLRTRRRRPSKPRPESMLPPVPSEMGQELMYSGKFGTPQAYEEDDDTYPSKLAHQLLARELGLSAGGRGKDLDPLMAQSMIPSSSADMVINYNASCYSGQFSQDGNFFFCCAQDFRVRMYDTANPYQWKYYKTVHYPYGYWTITDATLSPDNKYLAYTSITPVVALAPTDPNDDSEPWLLDLSERSAGAHDPGSFGIWSIRFSGDGRELVAGTQGHSIYVYDIETRQSILKIHGHRRDVNAVCYGDQSSPHILYSGSDDATLKVWDRRSMADGREAGVFLGHTEGLTYVDSKGDGRYVLSNGKDQSMKLWDLRKMTSPERYDEVRSTLPISYFDYRMEPYDPSDYSPHPHDTSLVTFRGHSVLKTLIRCHFSPPGSSDSRYVYSGSADGFVYIYNLDATLAGKIDVRQAIRKARPNEPSMGGRRHIFFNARSGSGTRVRDASWHPNAPVIAATSWSGYGMAQGSCSVHSWNDNAEEDESDRRMGCGVDERLEPDDGDDQPSSDWRMQESD